MVAKRGRTAILGSPQKRAARELIAYDAATVMFVVGVAVRSTGALQAAELHNAHACLAAFRTHAGCGRRRRTRVVRKRSMRPAVIRLRCTQFQHSPACIVETGVKHDEERGPAPVVDRARRLGACLGAAHAQNRAAGVPDPAEPELSESKSRHRAPPRLHRSPGMFVTMRDLARPSRGLEGFDVRRIGSRKSEYLSSITL